LPPAELVLVHVLLYGLIEISGDCTDCSVYPTGSACGRLRFESRAFVQSSNRVTRARSRILGTSISLARIVGYVEIGGPEQLMAMAERSE